jgi:hypothetical protein
MSKFSYTFPKIKKPPEFRKSWRFGIWFGKQRRNSRRERGYFTTFTAGSTLFEPPLSPLLGKEGRLLYFFTSPLLHFFTSSLLHS